MAANYQEEIKIDKYNLDVELERQAQLYVHWARKAVLAEEEYNLSQREYEMAKADYEKRIRKNPKAYGLGSLSKLTESLVKGEAERQPKVKRLYNRYMHAWKTYKILSKIEKGFSQRKDLLEALAYYDRKMFYAEPKIKDNAKEFLTRKGIRSDLQRERHLARRKK